jgi:hypothetical protein
MCISITTPLGREIDDDALLHERKEMPYHIGSPFYVDIDNHIEFSS